MDSGLDEDKIGLTLEELLARMAVVNQRYENSVSSTPPRWESGETMPSRRRLQEFGTALNLSQVEIEGLIALAGLEAAAQPDTTAATLAVEEASKTAAPEPQIPERGAIFGEQGIRPFLAET